MLINQLDTGSRSIFKKIVLPLLINQLCVEQNRKIDLGVLDEKGTRTGSISFIDRLERKQNDLRTAGIIRHEITSRWVSMSMTN